MRHFDYAQPENAQQAISSHSGRPSAYLGGGTNLIDLMKIDIMRPEQVVDINSLDLGRIDSLGDGRLRIGALVTNTALAYDGRVQRDYPVLSQALLSGASTQLRNKATTAGNVMQRVRCHYFRDGHSPCNKREPGSGCAAIGGLNRSLYAVLGTSDSCIASHPSDMCVAMMAIGATLTVQGPQGDREIPFADFHLLPGDTPQREHALEPDELITHVTLDAPMAGGRSGYLKLRDRASYQFALASSAVIIATDGVTVRDVRIALGGVGTKPWRAHEAEDALRGQIATTDSFTSAAAAAFTQARAYQHNAFKIPLGQQAIIRNLRDLTA